MRGRAVFVALSLLSCTGDFESFHVGAQGASGSRGDASAAGGASSGGASTRDAGSAGVGQGGGLGGSSGKDGGTRDAGSGAAGGSALDGSAGGAPSDGATGTGGVLGDGAPVCTAQQKRCGGLCSDLTNPATGCADPATCSPCVLANVTTTKCDGTGDCAPGTCAGGFGDCNGTASDGCELPITGDPLNCGACDRVCSTTNVAARICAASRCTSTCALGFANCASTSSGADDGCERDVRTNNNSCGSCSNSCSSQGLVCLNAVCGCTSDGQCKANGPPGGGTPTCDTATGQCHCGTTVCARGEQCHSGNCQCGGQPGCTAPATCCQNPAGCFDLATDPAHCGACGHACVTGFTCAGSVCQCDADDDCNGGTTGTCASGLCTCGVAICQPGQRCLGDGQCG